MKKQDNHKLIRLSKEIISIYLSVRLAEAFNGIDPSNLAERSGFIRQWALTKSDLSPAEVRFFHEQLVVKQKSYILRWFDMERRLMNMSAVARKWADYNDYKRLEFLLRDLNNSGYYTELGSDSEVTLKGQDARRALTLGVVTVGKKELMNIEDGWVTSEKGLVLSVQCPKAGPFIAIQDALQIAGFDMTLKERFTPNKLLELRISSSRESEMLPLLENISFPDSLRQPEA